MKDEARLWTRGLLVEVLNVGVRSGVKVPVMNVPDGVHVTSADVERAVGELLDEGPERTARRERARELAAKAKAAVEEGGSSYEDLTDMIRYVAQLSRKMSHDLSAPELGSKTSFKIEAEAALS
jgi:UDP-glucosyltransferase 73C